MAVVLFAIFIILWILGSHCKSYYGIQCIWLWSSFGLLYIYTEALLTLVRLDLTSMTMVDWRREIVVAKPGLYDKILAEDVVSFDVSSPLILTTI